MRQKVSRKNQSLRLCINDLNGAQECQVTPCTNLRMARGMHNASSLGNRTDITPEGESTRVEKDEEYGRLNTLRARCSRVP